MTPFQPGQSGNPNGRPLAFTPEELEEKVAEYFDQLEIDNAGRDDKVIATVSGLCYHLDSHRDMLQDYMRNPLFTRIIKRAMTRLSVPWENRLAGNNSTGAIFWLKNQGWKDTQTIAGDAENPLNVNHGLSESTQSLIDSITKA